MLPRTPWALLLLAGLGACAAVAPEPMRAPSASARQSPADATRKQGDGEQESASRSTLHVILFYLPNRVLDLFDIARAGVDVGPGVGIDLRATELATAGLMARTSAGVGLQTLRHLPIKAAAESYTELGPAFVGAQLGPSWYHDTWDVRAELHVLLVGAHACINLFEILDLLAGLITLDPRGDDC
ncbi:MAG: hypothetical protein U1E76_23580 [Planctomycetota bacterium]